MFLINFFIFMFVCSLPMSRMPAINNLQVSATAKSALVTLYLAITAFLIGTGWSAMMAASFSDDPFVRIWIDNVVKMITYSH